MAEKVKRVFADTLYWIARTVTDDSWNRPALEARHRIGEVKLVTTDEALTEFLTALAGGGQYFREQGASMVREIILDSDVDVIPQSRQSFLDGLTLYERRTDKGYSLTDCISMNACHNEGITEVLTNDRQFDQEGFTVLIAR